MNKKILAKLITAIIGIGIPISIYFLAVYYPFVEPNGNEDLFWFYIVGFLNFLIVLLIGFLLAILIGFLLTIFGLILEAIYEGILKLIEK